MVISECPRRIAGEAFEVLEMADWARRGKWPIGGGMKDETLFTVTHIQAANTAMATFRSPLSLEE